MVWTYLEFRTIPADDLQASSSGQMNNVIVSRLLCTDTMDMDVVDVLSGKIKGQNALLNALKFRAEKYFKQARKTIEIFNLLHPLVSIDHRHTVD